MKSIWQKTILSYECPRLENDLDVDVAIVGGGMAGILTAYYLKNSGLSVVVLEGRQLGGGVTANTTAKVTSQHGLIYDKLIKIHGINGARQYARVNNQAIEQYEQLIHELHIPCEWERTDSFVYSTTDTKLLKKEVKAAIQLGINASYAVPTALPFDTTGAVRFPNQAQFHPLKFLNGIAKELTCYENSFVSELDGQILTVESRKSQWDSTPDIFHVHAKNIVIATHFPFINTPGYYFLRLHQHRSYVLALENVPAINGMYVDASENGFSLRSYQNMILLGGYGHRTGKEMEKNPLEELRQAAKEFYPNSIEAASWATQDTMPLDHTPYIGRYSAKTPHVYVATGFQKWGMTSSMVAAGGLSKLIQGNDNRSIDVFSPQRLPLPAILGPFIKEAAITTNSFLFKKLISPKEKEAAIKKGYGPVCPHLGCTLTWNSAEKSWDCPCHGSRFDEKGRVIQNPATKGIKWNNP